jgi:hypothetical protein
MSEINDSNTGWKVEAGEVVPDEQGINAPRFPEEVEPTVDGLPLASDDEEAALARDEAIEAERIDEEFDPKKGLTRGQARLLNGLAADKRSGKPVDLGDLR